MAELTRERFEAWISTPPYERSIGRYGSESTMWPGAYRDYKVHLAWDAWQTALRAAEAGEPMTLRWLQGNLPWTIAYSESFEAHATPMNRVTHDVLHVMKSLGRVAAECEGHDHGRDRKLYGAALAKEVADLVICALHIARLQGFDLQDAVIDNSSLRNKVNIRALASSTERAPGWNDRGLPHPDEVFGTLPGEADIERAAPQAEPGKAMPANRAEHGPAEAAPPVEGLVEWLHKFINCVPFGEHCPQGDIDRAHSIVESLRSNAAQAPR